ncbi:DUF4153 domain-containing protein [Acidimangrovimonas sediminis]|uniref:DUF4153 domain-containing protein n=1 Tax=Acidimangrovimonas sediminis TaxID=2056283 RepID=UPI0011AEFD95|nr:DUF4153 domain-containing protein [Acidimangrovimonas sediminis]
MARNVLEMRLRLLLGLTGALAGVCAWLLFDVYGPGRITPRLHLMLTLFAGVTFGAFLILVGPLRLARAALSALALGAVVAGLCGWASLRYDAPLDVFSHSETVIAVILLSTLPLPYLAAAGRRGGRWWDYPALFSLSWSIVVRYASAWLFVAVVWAVIFLSDQLLQLVGIRLISDILRADWVAYVMTGLALGVGLAVVDELYEYLSPFLILRLLRVVMPVVTLVVAVFLIALPVHGFGNLFGQLSVAGTLLAMAVAAATLVTTALDRSAQESVQGRLMRGAVQLLALMLPALAALGGWAVWLRVEEHGLTPTRIAGLTASGVLLAYGVVYAVSVLMRGDWGRRIRRDNVALAVGVILLSALWLTPVLNAERISAQNRLARYTTGETRAQTVDLNYLRTDLGRAGADALARLRKLAESPDHAALKARFADLDAGRLTPGMPGASDLVALRQRLMRMMPVRPEAAGGGGPDGARLLAQVLDSRSAWQLNAWAEACGRSLTGGQPGCVFLAGDFLPDRPGDEALVLTMDGAGQLRIDAFGANASTGKLGPLPGSSQMTPDGTRPSASAVISSVLAGNTGLAPARLNALGVGGLQVMVLP